MSTGGAQIAHAPNFFDASPSVLGIPPLVSVRHPARWYFWPVRVTKTGVDAETADGSAECVSGAGVCGLIEVAPGTGGRQFAHGPYRCAASANDIGLLLRESEVQPSR